MCSYLYRWAINESLTRKIKKIECLYKDGIPQIFEKREEKKIFVIVFAVVIQNSVELTNIKHISYDNDSYWQWNSMRKLHLQSTLLNFDKTHKQSYRSNDTNWREWGKWTPHEMHINTFQMNVNFFLSNNLFRHAFPVFIRILIVLKYSEAIFFIHSNYSFIFSPNQFIKMHSDSIQQRKRTYQFELVPIDHNTMKIKWYQFQFAMKE